MVALLGGCAGRDNAASPVDVAQLGAVQDIPPRVTVNPADGAAGVAPTERVTVAVAGGRITIVKLATADGGVLTGSLSPDGERWASVQPLRPNTAYTLDVTSRSAWGKDTTTSTRFSTLAPGQRIAARLTPAGGSPVEADQAVSVLFDKPVGDREAVERALRVTANPAANGTTEWRSDRELLWRPDPAWPPGSKVTVSLDIFGKQLGNDMFGAADLRSAFTVVDYGPSQVPALATGSRSLPLPSPGQSSSRSASPSAAALNARPSSSPSGSASASARPSSAARPPRESVPPRSSRVSPRPSNSSAAP
jgi:hypothetical protein